MTQQIIEVARLLGIAVHDHIIIAKDGHAGLKEMQLIGQMSRQLGGVRASSAAASPMSNIATSPHRSLSRHLISRGSIKLTQLSGFA